MTNEIKLSDELKAKVIEAMIDKLLTEGMGYSLRSAIEDEMKKTIKESGLIDQIAAEVIDKVLTDKDIITATLAETFVTGIGEVMASTYTSIAREMMRKVRF